MQLICFNILIGNIKYRINLIASIIEISINYPYLSYPLMQY